jgi:hypothetical protein
MTDPNIIYSLTLALAVLAYGWWALKGERT